MTPARVAMALLGGLVLIGCRKPLDEKYVVEDIHLMSSDADTDQALADLNEAIADSDEVFELAVKEIDGDAAEVTLFRNGDELGRSETVEDGYDKKDGRFEAALVVSDFEFATVTVTAPNGLWIRGKATESGLTEGEILFRDPHRSWAEIITEIIVEEALEAFVEALVESLGGTPRTIDLSSLDVVAHFEGTPVGGESAE